MTQLPGESATIYHNNLLTAFSSEQAKKLQMSVPRMTYVLEPDQHAFGGGMAGRYYARLADIDYPDLPFDTVDMHIDGPQTVRDGFASSFMIAHFHPEPTDNGIYMTAVDPFTKLIIQLYQSPPYRVPDKVPFGGWEVPEIPVSSIADLFADSLWRLYATAFNNPVDPVFFYHADLLMDIVRKDDRLATATTQAWQHRLPLSSYTWQEAYGDAQEAISEDPSLQAVDPVRALTDQPCEACRDTVRLPLTPLAEINERLRQST